MPYSDDKERLSLIMKQEHHKENYLPLPHSISWDKYFMLQAMIASFKSKDPSTKVGCIIVDAHHHQISMGYNGMVAGIDESKIPWGKDLSSPLIHQKYGYVVHSEANAILHASKPLEGATLYVTLFPCNECAKMVASTKIAEVVYLSDKHSCAEHTQIAKKIFELSGVKFRKLDISENLLSDLNQHLTFQQKEASLPS